jgi:hypothetical protein
MDVDGADFFRIKISRNSTALAFRLLTVNEFRVFGSKHVKDAVYERSDETFNRLQVLEVMLQRRSQ